LECPSTKLLLPDASNHNPLRPSKTQ